MESGPSSPEEPQPPNPPFAAFLTPNGRSSHAIVRYNQTIVRLYHTFILGNLGHARLISVLPDPVTVHWRFQGPRRARRVETPDAGAAPKLDCLLTVPGGLGRLCQPFAGVRDFHASAP